MRYGLRARGGGSREDQRARPGAGAGCRGKSAQEAEEEEEDVDAVASPSPPPVPPPPPLADTTPPEPQTAPMRGRFGGGRDEARPGKASKREKVPEVPRGGPAAAEPLNSFVFTVNCYEKLE